MTVAITLLVFLLTGVGFLLANLTLGRLVRPARPNPEKGSTYECGEPPVGPAWVQFDIRIYVAALIFLIFDVELAFFFPWATLFGSTLKLRDPMMSAEDRAALSADVGVPGPGVPIGADEAGDYAGFLFWEFLTFFALLLLAFAYLWRRGDLDWVRSQLGQKDMVGREKAQKDT